jgi:serine/threonine protein kinase
MPVGHDEARLAKLQGTRAGGTAQLARDFLAYARQRFDVVGFKNTLVERLLPTVPRQGEPRPIAPRESFGKFDVRGRLGKGGMAEVYLVYDPEFNADSPRERDHMVALKVMKDTIAHEPSYVQRFLREAANTALIDHHNVVNVHEVGSVEGRLYFTMELIEGETLKDYMSRGMVEEDTGVQILCQLVDGLMAAHEREIGHRDLKPSNVMLVTSKARYGYELADEFDVAVKITDFGLAEMLDTDVPADMPEGRFLGTAKYVAPEVVKGETRTLKSDVFSLGILAFQMFAGRAPFRARNKLEYITANLNAEAPPLQSLAEVTPELSRVIDAMLVKDPAQRQDAEALRRDLGRLILRKQVGDPIEVGDDPESVFHVEGAGGTSARVGASSIPTKHLVGAGGGLLAVIVLLLLITRGGDPDQVPPPPPTSSHSTVAPTPSQRPQSPPPNADNPLLTPVPAVAPTVFKDRLARMEYLGALEAGDEAWTRGEQTRALTQWTRAQQLCPMRLEPLDQRVQTATREVSLRAAADAERAGDRRLALAEITKAVAAGAEGNAKSDRDRLERLVKDEDELDRRLVEVRGLGDAEAIETLRSLLPLAERVGRGDAVRSALRRLGAEPADEPAPTPSPSTAPDRPAEPASSPSPRQVDPAARLRAEALLGRAEDLFTQGDLSGAEQALRTAEQNMGPSDRSRALWMRLEAKRGGGR